MRCPVATFALAAALGAAAVPAAAVAPAGPRISVHFDRSFGPPRGRLLVFLQRASAKRDELFDPSFEDVRAVEILGTELTSAGAGGTVEIPLDADAYPAKLPALAPGRYTARAELDVDHRYTYDGGQPGDPVSASVPVTIASGRSVQLVIDHRRGPERPRRRTVPGRRPLAPLTGTHAERFTSPALSAFFGRPVQMYAYVVPPSKGPAAGTRSATVYVIDGYGSSAASAPASALRRISELNANGGTALTYVWLDAHVPLGHSVFADSANNGPWGTALTTELIPYLESKYPTGGATGMRFVTGHSSGGWTSMWLQVAYPDVFGGTWPTSPDPLDFHDFTGPDLLARPLGNMYVDAAGKPYQLVRDHGRDLASLRDYVLQERALGPYGGQFGSFDAVFSPRGNDGRPMPLFDRETGVIDPFVAATWEKYDIATILRQRWSDLGPKLRGKIHLTVGSADTFHLERDVYRVRDELATLPGADASVVVLPNRTHMNVYAGGLNQRIDREITAAANAAGAR